MAAVDIKQLETFSAILATGSLTAAARQTGRSPSALTRLVQELEAQLGFPLFDRNGPRITPTERALLFHDEVERTLAGLRALEERAAALARGEEDGLDIAAIPALAAGLVPAALGLAHREQRKDEAAPLPGRLSLTSLPAGEVVRALLDRRAQLGFASLPLDHRGLDLHWIGESRCVAVLAEDDPLAASAVLPLRALAGRRLITVADPQRLRQRIDAALRAAGARPAALMVANASLNAVLSARAGLGVALVDPVTAAGVPLTGTVTRPIDAAIHFLWSVATPAARPPGPAARTVIAAAARAAEALPGFRRHPPQAMAALCGTPLPAPDDRG